ncbi:MAG: type II toxin-antitoxin system RelE/ParE family toxin [Gammaproteobacteria bacterium]|nr:type II toxin-antitoxin system RelE/ParE family toxin [Gammaproteobacteria bacterium]
MPELKFHPDVAVEIKASYDWYQKKADGLGDDFLNELESAYQAISELPDTWPKFQRGFRRFLLSKFPFSIIYQASNEFVYVVAVMHNSRKPEYWLKRT